MLFCSIHSDFIQFDFISPTFSLTVVTSITSHCSILNYMLMCKSALYYILRSFFLHSCIVNYRIISWSTPLHQIKSHTLTSWLCITHRLNFQICIFILAAEWSKWNGWRVQAKNARKWKKNSVTYSRPFRRKEISRGQNCISGRTVKRGKKNNGNNTGWLDFLWLCSVRKRAIRPIVIWYAWVECGTFSSILFFRHTFSFLFFSCFVSYETISSSSQPPHFSSFNSPPPYSSFLSISLLFSRFPTSFHSIFLSAPLSFPSLSFPSLFFHHNPSCTLRTTPPTYTTLATLRITHLHHF